VSDDMIMMGCILWFAVCWIGYVTFAKYQAKRTRCIASVMHRHRIHWMERLLRRDSIIADTALLASLERQSTFFASTTILILAALLTLLSASDRLFGVLTNIPGTYPITMFDIQIRLMLMISIFIYAFFTFTWSTRQYVFCSVLMGASPDVISPEPLNRDQQRYAIHLAKVIDHASHSYNYGLRSYYFAMATLAWFIHPLAFLLASTGVVLILYQREFHSNTLKVLDGIDKN